MLQRVFEAPLETVNIAFPQDGGFKRVKIDSGTRVLNTDRGSSHSHLLRIKSGLNSGLGSDPHHLLVFALFSFLLPLSLTSF